MENSERQESLVNVETAPMEVEDVRPYWMNSLMLVTYAVITVCVIGIIVSLITH